MKNIIGLVRVSTRMQGETRNGLESQRAEIERWASYNGYNLVTILEEVGSGRLPLHDRPVLQAAISMARKLKCQVVVTKEDRCSRDAGVSRELMQKKKLVMSIALGEKADGFVQHIMQGIAEKEASVGSERTKAGLAAAKARGVLLGNRTNLNEAREIAVESIKSKADRFAEKLRPTIERMLRDKMSFKAIAAELNSCGTLTARGGLWYSQTVINLVSRWK
jgi:DNA invertase Pin-like site-specific DNA recombinase